MSLITGAPAHEAIPLSHAFFSVPIAAGDLGCLGLPPRLLLFLLVPHWPSRNWETVSLAGEGLTSYSGVAADPAMWQEGCKWEGRLREESSHPPPWPLHSLSKGGWMCCLPVGTETYWLIMGVPGLVPAEGAPGCADPQSTERLDTCPVILQHYTGRGSAGAGFPYGIPITKNMGGGHGRSHG